MRQSGWRRRWERGSGNGQRSKLDQATSANKDRENKDLNGGGQTEATQLRAVVHKKVAISEKTGRCRQNRCHSHAPNNPCGSRKRVSVEPIDKGAPQPHTASGICPPPAWREETVPARLKNSTFSSGCRDEPSARCGELNLLSTVANEVAAESAVLAVQHGLNLRRALPWPQCPLEAPTGHAVPTPRVLSARRVELTDTTAAARCAAEACAPVFFFRSLRQAAGLDAPTNSAIESLGRSHRAQDRQGAPRSTAST